MQIPSEENGNPSPRKEKKKKKKGKAKPTEVSCDCLNFTITDCTDKTLKLVEEKALNTFFFFFLPPPVPQPKIQVAFQTHVRTEERAWWPGSRSPASAKRALRDPRAPTVSVSQKNGEQRMGIKVDIYCFYMMINPLLPSSEVKSCILLNRDFPIPS